MQWKYFFASLLMLPLTVIAGSYDGYVLDTGTVEVYCVDGTPRKNTSCKHLATNNTCKDGYQPKVSVGIKSIQETNCAFTAIKLDQPIISQTDNSNGYEFEFKNAYALTETEVCSNRPIEVVFTIYCLPSANFHSS